MRIQHNIIAMNAYRNYNNNTSAISKNLEKLSSGYKINRAGDDAAGLAVSQKMRLQIAGLAQAQKNAKSGISYIQTAEGSLQEVHEMLERMYTLAEQSANGTFDDSTDRTQLQKEVNSLMEEINRIGKTANFNGMGIFKQYEGGGTAIEAKETQAGATDKKATYTYNFADATLEKGDKLKVTIAGVSKEIEATDKMDGTAIANAVKTAFDGQIGPDDGTKKFAATAADGVLTLTAAENSVDDNKATMLQASMAPVSDGEISFWVGAENIGSNKLTLKAMDLVVETIQIGASFNGVGVNVDNNVKAGNISGIDITDANTAMAALTTIKTASDSVSNMRGTLGAMQNRLDHTLKNLSVMQENMQDAESVIRDTDVAEEMMAYTKNNILVQSAQAMLAQANQIPQGVLQLLQ